jgi:hypothetical protein
MGRKDTFFFGNIKERDISGFLLVYVSFLAGFVIHHQKRNDVTLNYLGRNDVEVIMAFLKALSQRMPEGTDKP